MFKLVFNSLSYIYELTRLVQKTLWFSSSFFDLFLAFQFILDACHCQIGRLFANGQHLVQSLTLLLLYISHSKSLHQLVYNKSISLDLLYFEIFPSGVNISCIGICDNSIKDFWKIFNLQTPASIWKSCQAV